MILLGINSYHPDSSAAIIIDGRLIASCEEERFCRIKHFSGFPSNAIKFCLKKAGISVKDIDYITIPHDPKARIFKKIFYGIKMPALAARRIFTWKKTFGVAKELAGLFDVSEEEIEAEVVMIEHHRAHLAASFFVSGFENASLLSVDALGDFASTMWARGEGNRIKVLGEVTFPHSLGFYYTALTQYLGFLSFGDEYKVMGLASYGSGSLDDKFKDILKIEQKAFKLGLDYFLHHKKYIDMNFEDGYPKIGIIFSSHLERVLGEKRISGAEITVRHKDIAFSAQKRLEEAMFGLVNNVCPQNMSNLCLSGGVAHNCVAAGKLFENSRFDNMYIPPAPGDAGLAVGSAFYLWNHILGRPRSFQMDHAYWGPEYGKDEIDAAFSGRIAGADIEKIQDEDALCRKTALAISEGNVVGWFQGRMEFGPRALGNRSILADPRRYEMVSLLNNRIKRREAFRPFAPSVLKECTGAYFENSHESPFMAFAYKVRKDKKDEIPAVCHVDGTARLQTVSREANPLYWRLINEFKKITGIPVLINTSFNEDEPIVCSPEEAIDCFFRRNMDILVMGQFFIRRAARR